MTELIYLLIQWYDNQQSYLLFVTERKTTVHILSVGVTRLKYLVHTLYTVKNSLWKVVSYVINCFKIIVMDVPACLAVDVPKPLYLAQMVQEMFRLWLKVNQKSLFQEKTRKHIALNIYYMT